MGVHYASFVWMMYSDPYIALDDERKQKALTSETRTTD